MKKLPWLIAIISILFNGAMIYLFFIKGNTTTSDDNRIPVVLTEYQKDFALSEMRGFLESIQQINQGIIDNNPDMIIEAATKSGGSVIEHAPKGMVGRLPLAFKQLGFGVHDKFDLLAESMETEFNVAEAQLQLNSILLSCVTCHKGYKIISEKTLN